MGARERLLNFIWVLNRIVKYRCTEKGVRLVKVQKIDTKKAL